MLLLGGSVTGRFRADDINVLNELARRAALAVDNARLYEERTAIAQALQALLLPSALPSATGVDFGARYAAAGEGNEVGGDFYDVFGLPDGGWGLAIGDVCGKGAEAAAITGMARNVLRLLIEDGAAPQGALSRLNEVILGLGDRGRFCTTSLATVHRRGEALAVRVSHAGHPLPVLVGLDGKARFVGRTGTVLGIVRGIELADDELVLQPGEALVFYTDGVTERRDGLELYGDERLLACLGRNRSRSADGVAGDLERDVVSFGGAATRDDLAVLVLRCPLPTGP